ncbi:hypothetical protein COX99_02445 [Candidatus Pacearchaeota archaeon CG_4_10_14_0_2_um_filter_31_10]|nr:MAG: hypothetical protein COU55_03735 [Candidatus Pacearchaeota archaeon CG10_big_fil_rev_8_21_14_0_10_31_59]PIZ80510.1 MAG: hypothetical protein COX99_02445 [Candidatus Pacearchaeota archaeon CG_4_10_14_0_2_um_filter_31_10]
MANKKLEPENTRLEQLITQLSTMEVTLTGLEKSSLIPLDKWDYFMLNNPLDLHDKKYNLMEQAYNLVSDNTRFIYTPMGVEIAYATRTSLEIVSKTRYGFRFLDPIPDEQDVGLNQLACQIEQINYRLEIQKNKKS